MVKLFIAAAVTAFCVAGCVSPGDGEAIKKEVFAMDTYMTLTAYGDGAQRGIDEAAAEIERLDKLLSVVDENSEVYALNKDKRVLASPDTKAIIDISLEMTRDTKRAFDITIYPVVRAWGFTTGRQRVPSDGELQTALRLVGAERVAVDGDEITLDGDAEVDLGAVAKGYAGDKIAAIFKQHGVTSGLLSLGGNVQAVGAKPNGSLWNVALQDPEDTENYIGVVKIADSAVITSGVYQRYFEQDGVKYHHIFDPATGRPAESGLLSVTIVADNGAKADILATAMFVMGKEKAVEYWRNSGYSFEMIIIKEDGGAVITDGLSGAFEPRGKPRTVEVVER